MDCSAATQDIIAETILQEINEIKKRMQCSKGFLCAKSGFSKLCRAKDVGLDHHLLCLEYVPSLCDFVLLSDRKYFCTCPLHVFLTKNLHKKKMHKVKVV